jgi:hypothetical protein
LISITGEKWLAYIKKLPSNQKKPEKQVEGGGNKDEILGTATATERTEERSIFPSLYSSYPNNGRQHFQTYRDQGVYTKDQH